VHARWQVVHFDTRAQRSARAWTLGTNSGLPQDVSISWCRPVPPHFHARYCAEARTYRYYILNRGVRSALATGRAALIHKPLDHEPMREAALRLLGEHDFSAFRSSQCQAHSPVRRMHRIEVLRRGDWVVIDVTANAFLHHMVRNIAGLLIAIGRGDLPATRAGEVLQSRDRRLCAATAPAAGLYFWSVHYSAAFGLPDPDREDALRPDLLQQDPAAASVMIHS